MKLFILFLLFAVISAVQYFDYTQQNRAMWGDGNRRRMSPFMAFAWDENPFHPPNRLRTGTIWFSPKWTMDVTPEMLNAMQARSLGGPTMVTAPFLSPLVGGRLAQQVQGRPFGINAIPIPFSYYSPPVANASVIAPNAPQLATNQINKPAPTSTVLTSPPPSAGSQQSPPLSTEKPKANTNTDANTNTNSGTQ